MKNMFMSAVAVLAASCVELADATPEASEIAAGRAAAQRTLS